MDVTNLAQPHWLPVRCVSKIVGDVVCQGIGKPVDFSSDTHCSISDLVCADNYIKRETGCIEVTWMNNIHHNLSLTLPVLMLEVDNIREFEEKYSFLVDASSFKLSPVVLRMQNSVVMLIYDNTVDKYMLGTEDTRLQMPISGFIIQHRNNRKAHPADVVFNCTDTFISVNFVCNDFVDCPDSDTDELYCNCTKVTQIYPKYFDRYGMCEPVIKKEFIKSNFALFTKYELKVSAISDSFECKGESTVDISLVGDLFPDCRLAEDEENFVQLLAHGNPQKCSDPSKIPCLEGYPRCYNISLVCLYRLDIFGKLVPCRNGRHLESCTQFECNARFKCPHSYCIPWDYVCNGKTDCPQLEDESQMCNSLLWCKHLFRCNKIKTCVHVANVCDGHPNCPLEDDEIFCQLKEINCPNSCHCMALTILCSATRVMFNLFSYPYVYATVLSSGLSSFDVLSGFQQLSFLNLRNTSVGSVCHQVFAQKLIFLSVNFSPVKLLEKKCFPHHQHLIVLDLSTNKIYTVQINSFVGLLNLTFLNLSHNYLSELGTVLQTNQFLKVLSVLGNELTVKTTHGLQNLNIFKMETEEYSICCMLQDIAECSAPPPWYVSCSQLLIKHVHIIFILASILTIGTTLLTFGGHSYLYQSGKRSERTYFHLVVVFMCTNNFLYESYLVGLWIANEYFGAELVANEVKWRASGVCFTLFGIMSLFCFTGPCLAFYVSLSRFKVVKCPIKTKFKQQSFSQRCIISIFLVSFFFTLIFLVLFISFHKIVPDVMCFPFLDPGHSVAVVKVLTFFTTSFQVCLANSGVIAHVLLFVALKDAQDMMDMRGQSNKVSATTIIQLVVLSMTNICCCAAANSVYVVSHFKDKYSIEMVQLTISVCDAAGILITNCVFVATASRNFVRKLHGT